MQIAGRAIRSPCCSAAFEGVPDPPIHLAGAIGCCALCRPSQISVLGDCASERSSAEPDQYLVRCMRMARDFLPCPGTTRVSCYRGVQGGSSNARDGRRRIGARNHHSRVEPSSPVMVIARTMGGYETDAARQPETELPSPRTFPPNAVRERRPRPFPQGGGFLFLTFGLLSSLRCDRN